MTLGDVAGSTRSTTHGVRHRFAQLTYTSSDRSGGPGGWRVQDARGDLTPAEAEALTRRIVPRFTPVSAVPDYPDQRQQAALPRRLVHAPVPELAPATAHWHTAPSGTDAHGRPGNVFVHVLLDRGPETGAGTDPGTDAGTDRRPTDLVDAPCWLRPFGSERADLAAVPDPPWAARLDRRAVLDFVFGPAAPSPAALCLLLDALEDQWGGGPVVLGLADMATAGAWVATVSHLMAARTARSFGWSTYERLADQRSWPRDLDLVVLPREDIDAAPRGALDDLVVVRDDEEAPRGRLGEHRTTRAGDRLAVSPWSVLVYEVLTERAPAEAALAEMDAVAAEVDSPDVGAAAGPDGGPGAGPGAGSDAGAETMPLRPAVALALAVVGRDVARHATAAARQVLETSCPPRLARRHPKRYSEILGLVDDAVPGGARGAREELRACPAGPRHAILRDLWLRRLLDTDGVPDGVSDTADPVPGTDLDDDPDGYGLADVADPRPVAAEIDDRVRTWTRALADRLDPAHPPEARARAVQAAVRLVDVLTASGAVTDAGDWDRVWARTLGLLADPAAPPDVLDVVGRVVGPIARAGMTRAAVGHLRRGSARPGTRLPVAVLSRLAVRLPRGEEITAGAGPDELQRELAGLQTLVDPDPQSTAWLVMMWDALAPDAGACGSAEARRLLGVDRPLRAEHLGVLVRHRVRADHPLLADALRRTLLAGPSDDALTALARDVLTDPATGRAYATPTSPPAVAARLRVLVDDSGSAARGGRAARSRREMLAAARVALDGVDPHGVEDRLWRTLLVTHVLATLIGGTHVRRGGARVRADDVDGADAVELSEATRRSATPPVFLAGFAAAAARPETRTALVDVLATSPDLASPTLVHSALELRLPPGDGPVHPAVLLGPWLTDAGHATTALDDAVRHRRVAGAVDDDDLEEALNRLRRDRRENRARWRGAERTVDVDTLVRRWWDGPTDPDGSDRVREGVPGPTAEAEE